MLSLAPAPCMSTRAACSSVPASLIETPSRYRRWLAPLLKRCCAGRRVADRLAPGRHRSPICAWSNRRLSFSPPAASCRPRPPWTIRGAACRDQRAARPARGRVHGNARRRRKGSHQRPRRAPAGTSVMTTPEQLDQAIAAFARRIEEVRSNSSSISPSHALSLASPGPMCAT